MWFSLLLIIAYRTPGVNPFSYFLLHRYLVMFCSFRLAPGTEILYDKKGLQLLV